MLKTVVLAENPMDLSDMSLVEVDNVIEYLMTKYDKWPDTARIYHNNVAEANDVTPSDEESVKRLQSLEGTFYCVIYPAEPMTLLFLAVAALAVVAAVLLRPKIPTVSQRNTQSASPNNELSNRTNTARPNGRIPDIFGHIRSTPDFLAPLYTTFENNQEVEHCLFCIGRGQYEIHDAYDGETEISQIAGSTVQVYKPFDNINTSTPYFQIGTPIADNFYNCIRSNSVNGQVLRAPNFNKFIGGDDIRFNYPDTITISSSDNRAFDEYFTAGDPLTVTGATKYENSIRYVKLSQAWSSTQFRFIVDTSGETPPGFAVGSFVILSNAVLTTPAFLGTSGRAYSLNGTYEINSIDTGSFDIVEEDATITTYYYCELTFENPSAVNSQWADVATYGPSAYSTLDILVASGNIIYNLNGTYQILSVSPTVITLANPTAVNPDWPNIPGGVSDPFSAMLTSNGPRWVGPFILEATDRDGIIANFVALNGLYKDDGEKQFRQDVAVRIEVTPVNLSNVPTGVPELFDVTLVGSSVNRDTKAATIQRLTPTSGRCSVRAYRLTDSDKDFRGSVVDEVKWRDVYSMSILDNPAFGNVTTVRTKSYATAGALSVKERKLNMLVTRQIQQYLGGTSFSADLRSIPFAADIIMHVCKDPFIGNRQPSELDLPSIHNNAYQQPFTYFGTEEAVRFDYTLDNDKLSFEETVQMIAQTAFCVAYRQGNVVKLKFEKETNDSLLLFNHRNKLPGSEMRTVTFGNVDDNDGVELEYVSPVDDAVVTMYLPADRSAINPKKIETAGIRNARQAYFHAWRQFNKLKFQNTQTEFEATHEADMSIPTDRILVADNTRPETQDGEIVNQEGLIVYTSQKLVFDPLLTYSMFLQLYDGTVQGIAITPGPIAASAVLAVAPFLQLSISSSLYARTTYIIVSNTDVRKRAFLVTEKITQENMTSKIRASNYDARFYERDKDFINGLI